MFTIAHSFAACLAVFSLIGCAANSDPAAESSPTADTSADISVSKCKGALPHICEVCADGKSECAHWTVKNKKCAVEICTAPTTCVETSICATDSHFDHTACKCVPDQCIQTVLCASTGHFDHATCKCVAN